MKKATVGWALVGMLAFTAVAWGQFPYGASDTVYGLRSRIAENPNFQYFPSPQDWRDINIYQLFTDRFADGDPNNNTTGAAGINRNGWYVEGKSFPQNRNYHHGGDWKGLKDNLDYLSGMGVRAVWISGVQMNAQGKDTNYTPYHMYHPTDFFRTDPTSGTFQELKDLIDACHARGIYVILDVVINHTADLNGLWGNSQNDDKQYWPNGNGTHGWWDGRRHAAPFTELSHFHNNGTINCWDCSPENLLGQFKGTDDLKTEDPQIQQWLDLAFKNLIDATDCDGFRVDAIKHVEYNWCKKWADDMRKHAASRGKNDFILFGELFTYDNNALASYCKDPGYSYNSALFFPLSQNIKSVFVDGQHPSQLTQQLNNRSMYGEGADRLVAFIDNHDVNRIALMNGGDTGNDVWKLRPALSFLYLGTPVPCLYYGTEHAFDQGGHYNGSNRTPDNPDDGDWQRETMFDRGFQPGPAQGNKLAATSAPLYQHIKALNQARAAHKSLTRGSFAEKWSDGAYAFSRIYDNEEALVALNLLDGNKSINPTVSKPDGTEFVNALNPSDKVTVSGGRISFSMSGKETKVYVAGIPTPEMFVRGTHNSPADGAATATDVIFVNTEAGPTGVVASAKVGYSSDGGTTWTILNMSPTNWASQGGTWFNARLGTFPANTVIKYFIEIADADGNKKWDNNNSQNFSITVLQPVGAWVRNVQSFPVDGDVTELDPLYVNAEAGPSNTLTAVRVGYSTNGTTWTITNMTLNADWGSDGGNWYNLNLGTFPAGTLVRYYVEALGITTNRNDNGGLNYQVTVRSVAEDLWIGNTRHSPTNGDITAASTITITSETWPAGIATNVAMVYSIDGGATWSQQSLSWVMTNNNNDIWSAALGPYPDGTVVQYALVAQSTAPEKWDNNGGQNFRAIVGEVGVRMMAYSPVIGTPGSPDNLSDSFDFDTSGQAATTSGTNGFGSFGNIYVNYDDTYLYVGGTGVSLPTDSDNNAYIVFLSGGANAGSGNLWGFSGMPEGLDTLHNTAYQPAINVAILLGDVYGDGSYSNFNMYRGDGFSFGQGIFATPSDGTAFAPVAGALLSQFGGYGYSNRLASNWESAIPLSAFGVSNAASLTNLYISGLMVTGGTSNDNRFISGRYLGASATLGNEEQPDEWGNFAYSFVNLAGLKIIPPKAGDDLGVPESWITNNLPPSHLLTSTSDYDNDGQSDRDEYFAGLNPTNADALFIESMGGGKAYMTKHGGQAVTYVMDVADRVEGGFWNWTPYSTHPSVDGVINIPAMPHTAAVMRIRVEVPPLNQPSDRVTVGATPAGGNFSAESINIVLSVSGVNVTSSTYTVQGGAATAYIHGQVLAFGAGMTNGQTRTLTLNGGTLNGVTDEKIYTFTRTAAPAQINWTGNVNTDPAAGSWDTGEALTIRIQTAPIGAAASVGALYRANGGTWIYTNMTKTGSNATNDLWAVNIGSFAEGTVIQYALEAKDAQNNSTWDSQNGNNYSISVNGGFIAGGSKPYSTNPTKGQYRSSGITIDGANTGGEWTTNMLIALDMVNDDPRSLGSNWTMHEAPIDLTHAWACWDDNYLYLAWQFVDVTDVLDPANAGGAASGKISNNQGHLISIVLNTKPGGSTGDMWAKSNSWTGVDTPDFQLYMRGDLWANSSYMSTALPDNLWAGDPQLGTTYNTFAGWGITVANGSVYVGGSELWGVGDCDDRNNQNAPNRNFLAEGHNTARDSFYEIKIPLTSIDMTRATLESGGLGVMIIGGSTSALDSIPNSTATTDTQGAEVWNSPKEWADADVFTEPFARIGN
ncbi:MAG TPA: alpha-amylase family glycosyl hydrolase [Kiritimatiellia bacterium]|nr:alpha-amylase family glycosyl hydrolase [Kiritimatiellia bacterium]